MEPKKTLKIHSMVIIAMLVLQYLLGIATNLFVKFPNSGTSSQFWEFTWSQSVLACHIVLGILLLVSSLVLLIRSIVYKNKQWIIISLTGCIAITIAGITGALFIPSQKDLYSFIMSIAFILALLTYFFGLYISKNN
jgi:hypothetical protein